MSGDRLVNLTPHPVQVLAPDGWLLAELPVAGPVARRAEHTASAGQVTVGGSAVPLLRLGLGEVTDLPPPEPGTWYVVSRPVADAAPEREDLLVPLHLVRDREGRPAGCRAFARGAAR